MGQNWVQAQFLSGGTLAWAELSADNSRVDWIVSKNEAAEPCAWGTERLRRFWRKEDVEEAFERAFRKIQQWCEEDRYDVATGST